MVSPVFVSRQTDRWGFVLLLWTEQQQRPSGVFERLAQDLGGFWVCNCLAWASLGHSLGLGGTSSLLRNSAFSLGAGIPASLDCPHGTMGPILRTLEQTGPAEKGWILVGHKGPQCHDLDQGTHGGKEQIHAPSQPPSVIPRGHCPLTPFRARALKSQHRSPAGAPWVGKLQFSRASSLGLWSHICCLRVLVLQRRVNSS